MSFLRIAPPNRVCNVCSKFSSLSISATDKGLKFRPLLLPFAKSRQSQTRAFGVTRIKRVDKEELLFEETKPPNHEDDVNSTAASKNSETATSIDTSTSVPSTDALPWYLKQQASIPSQIQKPIEIPDLPKNPPPLLQTLLEYISNTAGLDDLEVLDLREIDPPPALGSKLIMVFATARSEKHLHVSADRLCRYLRREHGLKANADGLLGRNELKIKLRRKAKRMRMFANMGGSALEGSNIDDGIRTNWICCTIGKIPAHPLDTDVPGDGAGVEFVGFRDVQPGVNVVVQMFTEEKRTETDLETLWNGVLKTHQTKNQRADELLEEVKEDEESFVDEMESKDSNRPSATASPQVS